jgi:hypothetical protein
MKYPKIFAIACNLALLTTGAFAQPTVLNAVGPETDTLQASDFVGTLTVYSATVQRATGSTTYVYPHTSYEVYRNGHPFRHVINRQSLDLETPTSVVLPKGNYVVVAQSDTQGMVNVPVRIETGRKTVLHLDGGQD